MNSEQKLIFYFDDDGDGTGELFVEAYSKGFSGISSAWFNKTELLDFAKSLSIYPLSNKNPPKISGGFWKKDVKGELEHEHLAISVYPIDGKGNLGIQVRLATELWNEERPESQHLVRLEILTSYNALESFSKEIIALLNNNIEKAVLNNS